MIEVLRERNTRIYVTGDFKYRISWESVRPNDLFVIVTYIWHGAAWCFVAEIEREDMEKGFVDALAFLTAFHDGE